MIENCPAGKDCTDFRRHSPGCEMLGVVACPNDKEAWDFQVEKASERRIDLLNNKGRGDRPRDPQSLRLRRPLRSRLLE